MSKKGKPTGNINDVVIAIEESKGIPRDRVYDALEKAMVAAYRKNCEPGKDVENVYVQIDRETGAINIYLLLEIVDQVEDEKTEISLKEAQAVDPEYEIGDQYVSMVTPDDFGFLAVQNAKNIIAQRIREAEREVVYERFKDRIGEIVTGRVRRVTAKTIFIALDKAEAFLPRREQVPGEVYEEDDKIQVYIMDVREGKKGAQIFVSRTHPALVARLFAQEVPEIEDGTVEIKGIAREAGNRTKVAVFSKDPDVDAVGACVGNRGMRVQRIVNALGSEKVDIVEWSDDPIELIRNLLSPANVMVVEYNEETKDAVVIVPDDQLSLAIGRGGQNVRLAAKVFGNKVDIKGYSQVMKEQEEAEMLAADNSEEEIERSASTEAAEAAEEMAAELVEDFSEEGLAEDNMEEELDIEEAADEHLSEEAEKADETGQEEGQEDQDSDEA